MALNPTLSAVLTVLFSVTGVGYLTFVLRSGGSGVRRVGDVLHLLMSVAMLSMPWSWGMRVAPPPVQIVVFGAATVFYLALLALGGRLPGHGHEGGRPLVAYHVVMMAAMVVMALLMQGGAAGSTSMADMDMGSGMSGLSMTPALAALSWVLVIVFAAGAAWMATRTVRALAGARPGAAAEDGLLLLMSVGMALGFLPA